MGMPIQKALISIAVAATSIPIAFFEGISNTDITSILVQLPIVAAFIIFILSWNAQAAKNAKDRDKVWQNFFAEQRREDRKTMNNFGRQIEKFNRTAAKCQFNQRRAK